MGGGVAVFDANGDGWLDLFFCDGKAPCRLFLNRADGTFADASEGSGAPGPASPMGAAVGDVDGDGREDLFVSGWRGQKLYRNIGGGKFEDVTTRSGLESDRWSTSAAFADLDGDGDLDLYVANYLDFDPTKAPFCAAPDGRRDYCGPEEFRRKVIGCIATTGRAASPTFLTPRGSNSPRGGGWGSSLPTFAATVGRISTSPMMGLPAGSSRTRGG